MVEEEEEEGVRGGDEWFLENDRGLGFPEHHSEDAKFWHADIASVIRPEWIQSSQILQTKNGCGKVHPRRKCLNEPASVIRLQYSRLRQP
jgi:hypothetical protein